MVIPEWDLLPSWGLEYGVIFDAMEKEREQNKVPFRDVRQQLTEDMGNRVDWQGPYVFQQLGADVPSMFKDNLSKSVGSFCSYFVSL